MRENRLANRDQYIACGNKSVEVRRAMIEADPSAKDRLYGHRKGCKFSDESRKKMSESRKRMLESQKIKELNIGSKS